MKKSFNININGIIFYIDEDAYEKLNAYLERLKNYFASQEGGDEVINDIEARIAELLRDKLNEQKQVVNDKDIEAVIEILGEPAQMQDEEEREEQPPRFDFDRPKRLYRDPDNKIIGGVGGGMGAYFNTDPIWFRLLFIISFFVVGPLAYIIFWIAIPMARTTAEKLEMRGKKVNIDNIEQSVKEEFKDIGDNFQRYTSKAKDNFEKNKGSYKDTSGEIMGGFYRIGVFALKVLGVIAGLVFIVTGLSLATGLLGFFFIPELPVAVTDGYPFHFSFPVFMDMMFSGGLDSTLIIIGILIIIGLPLAGLIVLGLRLIFGSRIKTHYFGPTALIVWFVAILVTGFSIALTVNDFRFEERIQDKISINIPPSNTYTFKVKNGPDFTEYNEFNKYIFYNNDIGNDAHRDDFRGMPDFAFYASDDTSAYIIIESMSRGGTPAKAKQSAEQITYGFSQQEDEVVFEPWFFLPDNEKFRAQDVKIKIYLPEHARFKIDSNIEENAYPWFVDEDEMFVIDNGKIEEISED